MPYLYYALGFVGMLCGLNLAYRFITKGVASPGLAILCILVLAVTSNACLEASGLMDFWLWIATYIICVGVFLACPRNTA